MSKNLTRKGLALGAVVALGSSLFAGTPATAAPTAITFASAYGTSTTGILGEYFYLSTLVTGGANDEKLKFYVEGAAAADIDGQTRTVTDLSADSGSANNDYTPETEVALTATTATVPTTAFKAGEYAELAIKLQNVTATTSIKITPFIDGGQLLNDKPDSVNELAGSPITVNFVKAADVVATPTLKSIVVGSTVKATVALGGSVNPEQFRTAAKGAVANSTALTVDFAADGSADSSQKAVTWDTTDSVLLASRGSVAVAGVTYGATAYVKTLESAAATAASSGTNYIATLGAYSASGPSYRSGSFLGTANVVRSGSGSFDLKTSVATTNDGKLKSGLPLTVVITEGGDNELSTGASVTAGGKTLSNSSISSTQSISFDVVSAADGSVKVPVTYAGLVADNTFTAVIYSAKSESVTTSTTTFTAQDSVAFNLVNTAQSASADSVQRIAKGTSASFGLKVVDQFGQTPAAGEFQVRLAYSNISGSNTVAPAITTPVTISSGAATVTFQDNSSETHVYSVDATLYKKVDGSWVTGTSAGFSAAVGNLASALVNKFSAGSAYTVGSIAVVATKTAAVARAGATLTAGNEDLEAGTVTHSGTSDTQLTTAGTIVYTSTGAVAPGASVTYSAKGVMFKAGSVWAMDTLTVNALATGHLPAVDIYSNLVGKTTITLTSGSATKTIDVTFAGPVDGGSAWTVTAPSSILPGQTLKISGVLKDAYGAVVDTTDVAGSEVVKVVYTGPGYVTSTIAKYTDEDGVVSFSVLLGAADSGTATVKFIYAGTNGTLEETSNNDDVIGTASIVIGKAPVAAGAASAAVSGSKGKFYVSATAAAGKSVVVKVAGKFVTSFKATGSKKTVAVKATKGSKKVTVYVGGKLIATKTVSVK